LSGEGNGNNEDDKSLEGLRQLIRMLAVKSGIDEAMADDLFDLLLTVDPEKGISDEEVEQMKGYKQADVRKVFRIFYDLRIASYRRGKHPDTGATRYYWYLDSRDADLALLRRKKQVLEKLKMRLEYERSNEFYVCPKDGTRYTFDYAYEYQFTCQKCGTMLVPEDNSNYIRVLENRISRLEEEIKRDERQIFGH
jgi:transcription initiation factor TFIIE subunit alpha